MEHLLRRRRTGHGAAGGDRHWTRQQFVGDHPALVAHLPRWSSQMGDDSHTADRPVRRVRYLVEVLELETAKGLVFEIGGPMC